MAKIVIVIATYPPEPVVSAQMGRDLAVHLAHSGARVTVLCPPPSRPIGADYAALTPNGKPLVRDEEGVEVVRLPSFTAPHSRLLPRMRESWSFGRHVQDYLKTHLSDAEAVYVNTWPLLSQALIARHCSKSHIPLVWHIKDLYPESLLPRLPAWVGKLVAPALTSLDRWSSHQARHTVVLSDSIRKVYLENRGLPAENVTTVRDWIDDQRYVQLPDRARACAQYGVPAQKFTFLYLGNIGPVAGVELLIESFCAARMKGAQLVIVGDGSAKMKCLQLAERLEAQDVHFISDPEAANVPTLQSMGHVCLLPMCKGAGSSSIPSKLMAYLLSSKPILATLDPDCDTARCIREAQCGWVGEPEDAAWLTEKMKEVATFAGKDLSAMGARGRTYGLRHFSKTEGVERLAKLLREVGRQQKLKMSVPGEVRESSIQLGSIAEQK